MTSRSAVLAGLFGALLVPGCGAAPPGVLDAATARDRPLPIPYQPRELQAVKDVFAKYGNLYIAATAGEEVRLASRPWSGYWYPMAGTDLYLGQNGKEAPFTKLDRLAAALGRPGGIAAWEQSRHDHGIPAADWEGFCSAWSVASVTAPEPVQSVTAHGVTFSPGDLKAIQTKVHELYPTTQYGIRYDGDRDTDGTFQDLRPEAFHRLVQEVIGTEHHPLVFDTDPGVEVWSKPLYRMRWVIKADPTVPDAFEVDAYPWFVKERESQTDDPTADSDLLTASYRYRLYVDPATQVGGKALVVAGEWLDASLDAHPDYALVPADAGALGSSNPALNSQLDVVKVLFQTY